MITPEKMEARESYAYCKARESTFISIVSFKLIKFIFPGCLWLFFSLAASFWWLALAFNVFEMIVLRIRKEVLDRMYYLYHVTAWGIPFISVVIGTF